jgi:hypothetical protein
MTDYQHEKTLADQRAWLGMLTPEGLVVSPAVLADAQVARRDPFSRPAIGYPLPR